MSEAGSDQVFHFGGFTLDLSKGLLMQGERPVRLRPKAYALLSHLAVRTGRVVPKDELIAAVWPDVFVTEDSLTQSVRELRKALGANGPSLVRTVAKRGYLLAPDTPERRADAVRPTLAVLRFANGGRPEDVPLVDGIAEDIINGLSRFRSIMVLARNSSFAFLSGGAGPREAGRRLGVRFLLNGAVARRGDSLRIVVTLIEAASTATSWSETYAAAGDDLFAVLDDIVKQIVGRLAVRIEEAEMRAGVTKPPASLAAYELLLRGIAKLRGYGPDDNAEARAFFQAALAKDENYGLAWSYLALTDLVIGDYGAAPPDVLTSAAVMAGKGVHLDPQEARCHRVLGIIRVFMESFAAAEQHMRAAVALNPFDADTLMQLGYVLAIRGRALDGLGWIDKALKVNPAPPGWYHDDRALALYMVGDYDGAAAAIEMTPMQHLWELAVLAASLAQAGRGSRARAVVEEMARRDPDFDPRRDPRRGVVFELASDAEHMREGLDKAMASRAFEQL